MKLAEDLVQQIWDEGDQSRISFALFLSNRRYHTSWWDQAWAAYPAHKAVFVIPDIKEASWIMGVLLQLEGQVRIREMTAARVIITFMASSRFRVLQAVFLVSGYECRLDEGRASFDPPITRELISEFLWARMMGETIDA